MDADRMIESKRYRVRYRLDHQRKEREFVGSYLGPNNLHGGLDFNLRPAAGTSNLPKDAIIGVEPVSSDVPNSQPKVVI